MNTRLLLAFVAALGLNLAALRSQPQTPAPDLARNPPPAAPKIDPALPTIFVAGDSTAARGAGEAQQGWAVPFADYFDPAKVNVVNRARGGRSSRTFITEGLWDQLLADLKAGDIVLIQFGHNDGSPVNEDASVPRERMRARGSIPGLGEETQEIDNVLTKKHEVVQTFGWYLRKMIADTKAKGATPMVLSPTARNIWSDGRVERGPGRYGLWSYEIAKAAKVPFIDVSNLVANQWEQLGAEKVKAFYPRDHTHFTLAGADLHAATVVSGLKGLRPSPVTKFLSAKGEAVAADPFVWLRLPSPADPTLPTLWLVGDSTLRTGRGDGEGGQWGWGDYVGVYFDPAKINVVNRAVGGTGVRNFTSLGHWANVINRVRPGDVVMIQFGHNDNGPRGPLKGVGEETEERANPVTKENETIHTYGWYLRRYVAEVRAKGATPVVCSLVPRKIWKDGKMSRAKDSHAGWAEAVAQAERIAFVDLNEIIARRYDALGQAAVDPLFADAHTHTSAAGATLNAECVVAGLKGLKDANPLAAFLAAKAGEVAAHDQGAVAP